MQKVRDIMSNDIQACTPLDNVYEVAVKMKEWNVGAIPIIENDQLLGMITDRDLVVRGIAEKHPGSYQVTKVMSDHLCTISPDASADEAAQLMAEHQIRRLPVVEDGHIVGMVSLGDLSLNQLTDQQAGSALTTISENDDHQLH
ncbi:CBS domain-containing protein [Metabacillus idriensis]|uniref:CBS domain-containing protein n=1 Tax=Bacillaceae TaxID=186817 RepID=UPI00105A505B|nr:MULTISPECIES: CBS domain-containing protein [Bacillaceae]MDR0137229.1 CBS domain-containing protein [Metabacillus idriensis]TDL79996.1 CBS domain-containing protein [Peribacillus frigoritolerans]